MTFAGESNKSTSTNGNYSENDNQIDEAEMTRDEMEDDETSDEVFVAVNGGHQQREYNNRGLKVRNLSHDF